MANEYFWSIILEQDAVSAGLWAVKDKKASIVSGSKAYLWETDEDLVEKTDLALTEASEHLPDEVPEPNKTVFGLLPSWVSEGKIKKPYSDLVRLISQKMSLNPIGFAVLPEALAYSIKMREGSPLSGIVIGVGNGSIDVTLFRFGNIVGTVSVGRSDSLIGDITEGLSRFATGDNMPTRWILYDGRQVDLEEVKQEILRTDWEETGIKFLHTPQVEIAGDKQKVEAVSIAGASEIEELEGIEDSQIPDSEESNVSQDSSLSLDDLGFVIDKDIRNNMVEEKAEGAIKRKFGIPLLRPKISLRSFKPFGLLGRKSKALVVGIFAIVFVVLLGVWFYFSRAEVVVYVSPKNLQNTESIILDENIKSADIANYTFPANVVETEIVSEKAKSATGVKTVGEKASGQVKIRNGTSDEIKLKSGSFLISSDGLKFVLDEDATLPAAESPISPGEISVKVSANNIGEEYNLAKDTSFSVANYPKSEVDAISEIEFSGGSSKKIRTISESDIKSLRDELVKENQDKAKISLKSESINSLFIEDTVLYTVIKESVSNKAGEEADEVSMSINLKAKGLILPQSQIEEISRFILKDQIPDGFVLKSEQVDMDFQLRDKIGNGVWEFDVNLKAKLLPSIDTDKIRAEIAGRNPKFVEEYLAKKISGYDRSIVKVQPTLPGLFGSLPRRARNISIEIVATR